MERCNVRGNGSPKVLIKCFEVEHIMRDGQRKATVRFLPHHLWCSPTPRSSGRIIGYRMDLDHLIHCYPLCSYIAWDWLQIIFSCIDRPIDDLRFYRRHAPRNRLVVLPHDRSILWTQCITSEDILPVLRVGGHCIEYLIGHSNQSETVGVICTACGIFF